MSDDEKLFEHESYGMISINRQTGGDTRPMFGSNLERIPTRMVLRIATGVRRHHLGRDWYRARDDIIEVELTPAQFAGMISNPNVGDGVPCTISRRDGRMIESPPPVETTASEVRARYEQQTAALKQQARDGGAAIRAVLESSKLSKTRQDEIMAAYSKATRFLWDAAPFLVESFQEATAQTVTEAKLEIDAFMTHALHVAGVEALASGSVQLSLPAGDRTRDDETD